MRLAKPLEPLLKRLALRAVPRRGNRLAAPVDTSSLSRVLIYRPQRFGDMLATLPILRALRKAFPAWHLELWTSAQGFELLQPENVVDRIRTLSGRSHERLLARREAPFDLVLDLVAHDSVNALLTCESAARQGILAGFGKQEHAVYYDWARRYASPEEYALYGGLRVLELVGLGDYEPEFGPRFLTHEEAWAARLVAEKQCPIVLNLSSGYPWHVREWGQLLDGLLAMRRAPIILSAVGPDRALARSLASGRGEKTRVLPEGTTFREVACLVSRAAMLISGDTSLIHVAGPAGVPTLGLFSRRHNFRMSWVPPGDHVRILRSPVPDSLAGISVQAVCEAVDALWESRPARAEAVE